MKAYQGTALDLSRYQDNTFDITLLFGPMYHLFSYEDKLKALSEAKRVTKKDGIIFVAYVMNEYSVLVHGFRDGVCSAYCGIKSSSKSRQKTGTTCYRNRCTRNYRTTKDTNTADR